MTRALGRVSKSGSTRSAIGDRRRRRATSSLARSRWAGADGHGEGDDERRTADDAVEGGEHAPAIVNVLRETIAVDEASRGDGDRLVRTAVPIRDRDRSRLRRSPDERSRRGDPHRL